MTHKMLNDSRLNEGKLDDFFFWYTRIAGKLYFNDLVRRVVFYTQVPLF